MGIVNTQQIDESGNSQVINNLHIGASAPGGAFQASIYAGAGAPSFTALQGSLYLRTDGSSASTRAYINSNGSTSWVAVTTAS